jgi:Flp pilus assembly pilin Flp
MFGVFRTFLTNNDGFTAIEYGLIAAFTLIFASQLVSQF